MSLKIESRQAENIGKKIRKSRIKKGLTAESLASEVGCSQPQISRIEKGKFNKVNNLIHRICIKLEVKPNIEDLELEEAMLALGDACQSSEKARKLVVELARYLQKP